MDKFAKLSVFLSLFVSVVLADADNGICLVCYFTYFVLPIIILAILIALPTICICVYFKFFYRKSYWKESPQANTVELSPAKLEAGPPAYDESTDDRKTLIEGK